MFSRQQRSENYTYSGHEYSENDINVSITEDLDNIAVEHQDLELPAEDVINGNSIRIPTPPAYLPPMLSFADMRNNQGNSSVVSRGELTSPIASTACGIASNEIHAKHKEPGNMANSLTDI